MTVPRDVLKAFAQLVGYMWQDEEHDYEQSEDKPSDHIFLALRTIDDWFKANCPEYEQIRAEDPDIEFWDS